MSSPTKCSNLNKNVDNNDSDNEFYDAIDEIENKNSNKEVINQKIKLLCKC